MFDILGDRFYFSESLRSGPPRSSPVTLRHRKELEIVDRGFGARFVRLGRRCRTRLLGNGRSRTGVAPSVVPGRELAGNDRSQRAQRKEQLKHADARGRPRRGALFSLFWFG